MRENKIKFVVIVPLLVFLILLTACAGIQPTKTSIPDIVSTITSVGTPTKSYKTICQSIPISPTPDADEKSIFPAVDVHEHVRGSLNATVTIIEYGDFQCPGCVNLAPVLSQLEKKYPNELRIVFRQLPLYDIHDKALVAAQAAETAAESGKFWDMHDLLFENYDYWNSMAPHEFTNWLVERSSSIDLDTESFAKTLNSQSIIDRVQSDLEDALRIGLRTTPFLLINGQIYNGPRDFGSFDQIISLIVLGQHQFSSCPEMTIDPLKQYIAILHTQKGDITIQLFADKAPVAVNSFIFLARNHWYDNNSFFRVIPGVFAQTGDPSGTGLGGPGYLYQNEVSTNLSFNKPGVVAMANNGDDSNGSQFFITFDVQLDLDGKYTIFGQVIEGLEILNNLTPRDPETLQILSPGDQLEKITIIEN